MTRVLLDSNVLIDVLSHDPVWFNCSAAAMATAANQSRLIINAVIYAEVSVRYARIEDVESALPEAMFEREAIPFAAAFLAGKAHLAYRRQGGTRTSALPDFLIGAHAAVAGYPLLTRDAARYQRYFPKLALIMP